MHTLVRIFICRLIYNLRVFLDVLSVELLEGAFLYNIKTNVGNTAPTTT